MAEEIDIAGYTDEELIRKYSVISDGHRYIKASVLDAIGKRQAQQANRKPGDPGTKENPIFREKHAFIYNSGNRLVLWEDYGGIIPDEDNVVFHINPDIMEVFKLTHDMQPSEEQKEIVKMAAKQEEKFTEDCPNSSPEQLERFRRFGQIRNRLRSKRA